ncbi:uncharacterized protein BO97DRAFT_415464 [Aspergillus homomorphus CBS 101889]|uniref:Uncharacterized protein n=1 Tax=Aspergillus homomorphus (strain CBS 101889) TaxID=1450537 RepID=A0A395HT43_ASPHC|nr:hypothetical protein BO97DRAFT_415464 [Aspergillus homomorphus CBS 101889]RAL10960.1 hypothetical protein BO97DRAFT_415464 [Aspergillus homomorphus CBS 101889]
MSHEVAEGPAKWTQVDICDLSKAVVLTHFREITKTPILQPNFSNEANSPLRQRAKCIQNCSPVGLTLWIKTNEPPSELVRQQADSPDESIKMVLRTHAQCPHIDPPAAAAAASSSSAQEDGCPPLRELAHIDISRKRRPSKAEAIQFDTTTVNKVVLLKFLWEGSKQIEAPDEVFDVGQAIDAVRAPIHSFCGRGIHCDISWNRASGTYYDEHVAREPARSTFLGALYLAHSVSRLARWRATHPRPTKVNIEGVDKAYLLLVLVALQTPVTDWRLLDEAEAAKVVDGYIESFCGETIKCDISGDEADPRAYDQHINKDGAFNQAVGLAERVYFDPLTVSSREFSINRVDTAASLVEEVELEVSRRMDSRQEQDGEVSESMASLAIRLRSPSQEDEG